MRGTSGRNELRRTRKLPLALGSVYGYLETGPVVLLTTSRQGRRNVMPMTWHTMMEFTPPLVGCVVSNRNHSFEALRKSGRCVLNIPTVKLIKTAVACGNVSGRSVDKFESLGLTALPARTTEAPLIAECPVNLECRVVDTRLVRAYNFFILEVVKAWRDAGVRHLKTFHHRGRGRFLIAGPTRVLASRAK
jgi:flavin reductase (DIM6/NTAB) family NADH-FMN oxidoreductase RutF